MSKLFSKYELRGITLKNRIVASPTCQYSASHGLSNELHKVVYGARAMGGAGMVMVESTAVSPEGRIAPSCLGLWSDEHEWAFRSLTAIIRRFGAVPAIQLSHSGRKGSTDSPWNARRFLTPEEGGWQTVSPTNIPFTPNNGEPIAMDEAGIARLVQDYVDAATRALRAGFQVIEVHCAHGYLLNSFLSPITNPGKSFTERTEVPLRVIEAVRRVVPDFLPLLVRISATDWVEGGWTSQDSVSFSRILRDCGVDLIDCSAGGILPESQTNVVEKPGYLVKFADEIRSNAGIPTGAVGMITNPLQAESILRHEMADLIFMARELMRNPHWPLSAARELEEHDFRWPNQLVRADL